MASASAQDGDLDVPMPTLSINVGAHEPLSTLVYRELREAICDDRLPAGRRLVQNALADHLGISRTPVRDALLRLSQEGLVTALPWRGGYTVSPFTVREVLDIYEVRLPLELLAARETAGHHTRAQIAALRELNAKIEAAAGGPLLEQYNLNRDLHALIVAPSENEVNKRMLEQLWAMPSALRMYHVQIADDHPVDNSVVEHSMIIDALESGDADTIVARTSAHLEAAHALAVTLLHGNSKD